MRQFYTTTLLLLLSVASFAQSAKLIKAVGGTELEPDDNDQEIWQNNEWNGKFFYQGTGSPLRLCVTDGTSGGTKLVKQINADYFQFTVPAQNFIYIITERGSGAYPNLVANIDIWKSDGTEAGTVLVKALPAFNPFNFSSGVGWTSDKNLRRNFSVVGDVMYFMGWDAANGKELWRTDGTEAGTYMVKDIRPGTAASNPSSFISLGTDVYFFAAAVGFEQKLWKTDGTAAGTVQVPVPEPFFAVPYVGRAGNKIIFFATNTINGIEPWVTDGTPGGTFMLADVNPGAGNGTPSSEQNVHLRFNDKYCFFMGNKSAGGKSLWRTDGTVAGTIQLTPDGLVTEENFSGSYSDINNNFLYWIGGNQKLYRSDGTVAGTTRITTALSNAQYLKIYKDAAWFHARNADNVSNGEPFKSDGTAANTRRLEVQPGEVPSYPYGFFVRANKLYFFSDSYAGKNLYEINGDMTFNPSKPGDRWRDSANWNSGMPPGITDTVYLNAGITANVDGAAAYAGRVLMQPGSAINLAAGSDSLFVHAALQGTTVTGNGVLVLKNFSGDTVRLATALAAGNLNVQGPASIDGELTVSNTLNLTNIARLLANSSAVVLSGAVSTIIANENNYIVTNGTGALRIQNIGTGGRTGGVTFPIGSAAAYNPVLFTNSGTADVFSARVQPVVYSGYSGDAPAGAPYTGGAVNASWFITEGTAGGSNATVQLQWTATQELPSFDRTQSRLGHYTAGAWQLGAPGAADGSNPYTWSGSGITSFSPFGVLNTNTVLPVYQNMLTLVKRNNSHLLQWTIVADEGEKIVVERSANGTDFSAVALLPFAANGSYQDVLTGTGKVFYRLKLITANGPAKYSNIAWATGGRNGGTTLYPTVFSTGFYVQNDGDKSLLRLYTADGKLLLQKTLQQGTSQIQPAAGAGVLFYQVLTNGNVVKTGRLVKE